MNDVFGSFWFIVLRGLFRRWLGRWLEVSTVTAGIQDLQLSPTVIYALSANLMAETEEKTRETELNLFNAKGLRRPEFWQCMKYIAPTLEKKKWLPKEAVGKKQQKR